MKPLRIILFILMIISITLSTIYTLYRIPDYLGFCYKRTILFPNDNEIEAIQEALELSFPEGTEVKRIWCGYCLDPSEISMEVYIKLPQNDEGMQFIESYYSIYSTPPKKQEINNKSYNKDGSFVIEIVKKIRDDSLWKTLMEMAKHQKPIASIFWAITIIIIISYKIVSKKYKMTHVKIGSE